MERIAAYRTVTPQGAGQLARQILQEGVDVVTFTSSSTVRNTLDIMDGDKQYLLPSLIACIGPITAATARELGLRVDLMADENTVEGLADGDALDPLQQAFITHDGPQCGFCTSGQLMSARVLLNDNPDPTEMEARQAMAGNLCRCSNYNRYLESILAAAKEGSRG